jgi:hypothetical protein
MPLCRSLDNADFAFITRQMYLVMGFFSFPHWYERHHDGSSGVGVLMEVKAEPSNNVG